MKVAVVGAGYVGLATGLVLGERGHTVTFVEVDARRREAIERGRAPVAEPGFTEAITALAAEGRLRVVASLDAVVESDVVVVAVQTSDAESGRFSTAALESVAAGLGVLLSATHRPRWRAVVVRSTVPPGTTRAVFAAHFGARADDLPLAYVPEFVREGSALSDARQPDRLVVGAEVESAQEIACALFGADGVPSCRTTIETAELVKLTNNALLATCISFANQIARVAESLPSVDALEVLDAVALDRRLRGTEVAGITAYLRPGPGFGGSCLVKDLDALRGLAHVRGVETPLLDAVAEVNTTQPLRVVQRLEAALGGLHGRRVLLLGLTFKVGTDDVRGSVARPIGEALRARGAEVDGHDPRAGDAARAAFEPLGVRVHGTAEFARLVAPTDAVVLVTPWPEYVEALPALLAVRRTPLLFVDPRGVLRGVGYGAPVTYLGTGHDHRHGGTRP